MSALPQQIKKAIEKKIKENLQCLDSNSPTYDYLLGFYQIIVNYGYLKTNILNSNQVIQDWKKTVTCQNTMIDFFQNLPGLYSKLCIYIIKNLYDPSKGHDKQCHHLFPQFLYKRKKGARAKKNEIDVIWNVYSVSSVTHLFLHLIRYIEYGDSEDFQAIALSFQRGKGNFSSKNLKFPSSSEELKKKPFEITFYWLQNLFRECFNFIQNQIDFLTNAGRNSGEKRLKIYFRELFTNVMVWKSNREDLKNFSVIIPPNYFGFHPIASRGVKGESEPGKTLLVDLAVYLHKTFNNQNQEKYSSQKRNNLKKKLSRYLNNSAVYYDGHYYLETPSINEIRKKAFKDQIASEISSQSRISPNVTKILNLLGGYKLVLNNTGIEVEIKPKTFNSTIQLAEYCNQCCVNLKKDQYILNQVQITRLSKKLSYELSKFPQTNSGSLYSWILKPIKNDF